MNLKKYYITTTLMALILSPLMPGFLFFGGVGVIGIVIWIFYSKKESFPEKLSEVFFPIFLAFCYYMILWVLFSVFEKTPFSGIFTILLIPHLINMMILSFGGNSEFFPFVNLIVTMATFLIIIITRAITKKKMILDKKMQIYALIFICLSGVSAFQCYIETKKTLDKDFEIERVKNEINIRDYQPFAPKLYELGETIPDIILPEDKYSNKLKRLNEQAEISIEENYPKLDGATAAYPFYAAMVQEIYKGLDYKTVQEYVTCSKTDVAYERLINGEIDIFFGAQPSKQQIGLIKEKDTDFVLTPIAKEAFVFFVNKDNPIDSLTLEQIQDIYQKKITNWGKVGGNNEKIMPFQRPENSGSQTIMLAKVMQDKKLPDPLMEEFAQGMGGIISEVAEYRNYSSALGYSFRYFATGMKPNDNIKLLAIDGIEPSVENIRSETYPFTVDVYAVTVAASNENTEKLIQWILSEQGQNFIETCGYVKR